FAMRIDGARQRLKILDHGGDTGLRRIGAVAVRTAAVGSRSERAAAVAVLAIPVVGALGWIGIFHFIDHTGVGAARRDLGVVRRRQRMAGAVADPYGIAVTQHDVIGAGAAIDGLMEVIAHCVVVGQT